MDPKNKEGGTTLKKSHRRIGLLEHHAKLHKILFSKGITCLISYIHGALTPITREGAKLTTPTYNGIRNTQSYTYNATRRG